MVMDNIKTGKERQKAYQTEYQRYKIAMKYEFYLEAVAICYAVIEDRLTSFLHHAGIVTRTNENLCVNKKVYPYIRRLMKKDDNYNVKIKDISVKIELVRILLNLTEERAKEIDELVYEHIKSIKRKGAVAKSGYMMDLYCKVQNVHRQEVLETLNTLDNWRDDRNKLIHALLNKTASSALEAKKNCAENGYPISRSLDDYLVKPFKKKNALRKKYNIQ